MIEKRYTVKRIAETFCVHQRTVRRWIKRGIRGVKLRADTLGNNYRIAQSDLDKFLTATNRGTNGDTR